MEKMKIGISHGDINGISYEIIIKTLRDQRINEICTPILYGSPKVLAYYRKALNFENFSLNPIRTADEANIKQANIINCVGDDVKVELGISTEDSGKAAFQAIDCVAKNLEQGKIDALVTAPINKRNISEAGFKFLGHTEYFADKFNTKEYLMLMVSGNLRVGTVIGHLPVQEISKNITKEKIMCKLNVLNQSLIRDFNIQKPRIAVLSLNPHCGDEGLIGNEEKDIIIPTIEQARNQGIMALGPFSADGLFGSDSYTKFDAILAMYHDQGLAPFKALAFDSGVNYTAGLPIVRTSPAHGTAYEIAGQGIASEDSFRNAIYLAVDILKNRRMNDAIMENALKSMEKSEDLLIEDDIITNDDNE